MADVGDLALVIVGHVDHGKSTLVGRILIDTGTVAADRLATVTRQSAKAGKPFEPAFILDALAEEQRQGVTIDTTQVRFTGATRGYAIIDAPGHREFLRNMVSGAARADLAVLVIDAKDGIGRESKTHGVVLAFLGIRTIVVVINKMDAIEYAEARFDEVKREAAAFLATLDVDVHAYIPASGYHGDNVIRRSTRMPWYDGPTLLEFFEAVAPRPLAASAPLRLPVQDVYRFDERRILAGQVESGTIRVGDTVVFSPSGRRAKVQTIETWGSAAVVGCAEAPRHVGITIDEPLFIERGQVITHDHDRPSRGNQFRATVLWMGKRPFRVRQRYKIKLNTQAVFAEAVAIESVLNTETLEHHAGGGDRHLTEVAPYHIGRMVLKTMSPVAFDAFSEHLTLGRFVIVDDRVISGSGVIAGSADVADSASHRNSSHTSANVFWDIGPVSYWERTIRQGHKGCVVWLTGLPASGKSTIGNALAQSLFDRGVNCFRLDGDNLRHGLNRDLEFGAVDRKENIRRAAEVAKLLAQSGQVVIATFISPYRADRDLARSLMAAGSFFEVYVACPVDVCQLRDPKGLYQKARDGKIKNFTGLSGDYEAPETPDLVLYTNQESVEASVRRLDDLLNTAGVFTV